jgi:lysozyme
MKTGKAGIELINSFEKCILEAYKCPAKVFTIGYGHTGFVDGKPITDGMKITETKAIELRTKDLEKFEKSVSSLVTVKLNQNQFDALVSFSYNVGVGNLKSSTLLKKLNKGDYIGASKEFIKWNKGGGMVLPGLIRRRKAETELFTKNSQGG